MTWLWRLVLRRDPPWQDLCVEHDRAYWRGGTAEQRVAADLALARGVMDRGFPVMAALMWLGVRVGGAPWLPLPWRWGYGHPYFTPYVGF